MTEIKNIALKDLHNNTGFDLESGRVNANPRVIRDAQYKNLLQSLRESNLTDIMPLKVFEHDGKYIVIGGNMRLRALRELKAESVDCILIPQTYTADMLNKAIVIDNSTHGDWDMDMLANEWDAEQLRVWGIELPVYEEETTEEINTNALIEQASSEIAVREYSEDTNYDLSKLFRQRLNNEISKKITDGIEKGEIRKEIADVLQCRAAQLNIFNFDEIIKYYRSSDATSIEKELLLRLYLVFVAPKELFEGGVLKIKKIANDIYDDELLTRGDTEDETD